MKISELYGYIDKVKPNAFDAAVKNVWLNEVEGAVQSQVMLLAPSEAVVYAYDPEDAETDAELLVGAPYNKLYYAYLTAMIDFANGEYSNYSNTLTLFNTFWNEYAAWYSLNIHPADGRAVYEGYYLSAYGIAVRHGYTGSEDEWLADLKGENGPKGDAGEDGITPHVGENGNWYIGDTDSGVRAQGDTGPKGDTGPAGPKGDTGAAATDAQVAAAVDTWFDGHPEAVGTVADGSVTPEKTTFFDIVKKSSTNLIDPDAVEVGTIDTSTGADAVSGVHRRTAYIPVEPGHYLYPQDGEALLSGSYAFYDSSGAYLSTGANALPVAVPAAAATVRLTWFHSATVKPFLGESETGAAAAMEYEEYGERVVSATVKPENLPGGGDAPSGGGGGYTLLKDVTFTEAVNSIIFDDIIPTEYRTFFVAAEDFAASANIDFCYKAKSGDRKWEISVTLPDHHHFFARIDAVWEGSSTSFDNGATKLLEIAGKASNQNAAYVRYQDTSYHYPAGNVGINVTGAIPAGARLRIWGIKL